MKKSSLFLALVALCLQAACKPGNLEAQDSLHGSRRKPDEKYVPPQDGGLGTTMTMQTKEQGVELEFEPAVIELKPADEPVPALTYRFWQPKHTYVAGSAQLHFARALVMWNMQPAELRASIGSWDYDEEVPAADELEGAVQACRTIYDELRDLSRCEEFSWDHRLRELRGPEMYMYLLPEVQQSRDLARALNAKFHYHLQEKDVPACVDTLTIGFRLGAFVGQGETLVQKLVGIAIENIMLSNVQELIQLDECPNLYWALATLPRPVVGIQDSLEFELSAVQRIIPVLEEAEREPRTAEYWNQAWAQVIRDFEALSGSDESSRLAFALLGVSAVGPAKQRLIEAGWDAEEVQQMPAMRAVFIDASREVRMISDALIKGSYLPTHYGNAVLEREEENFDMWLQENRFQSGGAAIVGLLFPAVTAARSAAIRQEYYVNRLMTIEAIRMHAARNRGQLPGALDEMDFVPAILNPFSGQEFDYELSDTTAGKRVTLSGDVPPNMDRFKTVYLDFAK